MSSIKKRDWGLIVVGILLALCGIFFILAPIASTVILTIFIGAAFVVSGISNIVSYVRFRKSLQTSGWVIAYGILDIILGIMFLVQPLALSAVLPWVVGIFLGVFGVFEIIECFRVKKAGFKVWGWMLFSGIVTALVAIMLFVNPFSLAILIGLFVVTRGISLAVYGFSMDTFHG